MPIALVAIRFVVKQRSLAARMKSHDVMRRVEQAHKGSDKAVVRKIVHKLVVGMGEYLVKVSTETQSYANHRPELGSAQRGSNTVSGSVAQQEKKISVL